MKIISTSGFKNEQQGRAFIAHWVRRIEQMNGRNYEQIEVSTQLGKTVVYGINTTMTEREALVIFPGFRTSSLFWDLDNGLEQLAKKYRIFLVETNGQPTLSEGYTPAIKTNEYGAWAAELLIKLAIDKAIVAGASFGGLVCLKLCLVAPERVDKVALLNPGCLQSFSLSPSNLYYNMLPIVAPSEKNVIKFLDNAVFCPPHHQLSDAGKNLVIEFEHFALTQWMDKAQKPYAMTESDLSRITHEIYLLLGDKDTLFPFQKSKAVAEKNFKNLHTYILPNTAHGIECSKEAMGVLAKVL